MSCTTSESMALSTSCGGQQPHGSGPPLLPNRIHKRSTSTINERPQDHGVNQRRNPTAFSFVVADRHGSRIRGKKNPDTIHQYPNPLRGGVQRFGLSYQ